MLQNIENHTHVSVTMAYTFYLKQKKQIKGHVKVGFLGIW